MDSRERKIARAIDPCRVTYCPGIGTKRFAREMAHAAAQAEPGPTLSTRQRTYLLQTAVRYRRQLNPLVVQLAQQMLAEDLAATTIAAAMNAPESGANRDASAELSHDADSCAGQVGRVVFETSPPAQLPLFFF